MARKGRNRAPGVTLFPFLSILACVIGTLTLLLAGLALGEMAPPVDEAARERAEEYVKVEADIAKSEADTSELKDLITQANALALAIENALAELARLEARREAASGAESEVLVLLGRIADARAEVERLEGELADVLERLKVLRTSVAAAELKAESSEGQYLLQGGGSSETVPRFVECREQGLTLDPDEPEAKRVFIGIDSIADSKVLAEFLAEATAQEDTSLLFLIRPGGTLAYDRSYSALAKSGAKYGYIAVPGLQPIDFSLFQ